MKAYRITTPRLVLRPWSTDDAEAVKRAEDESRAHLRTFMSWAARDPESYDEVIAKLRLFRSRFDRDEDFMFGVFDEATEALVGGAGLHPRVGNGGLEIGYWVHAAHVRKGYATEVAAALTRVAFDALDARWVEIRCAVGNDASAGVPRKLGFTLEATLRQRVQIGDGSFVDVRVFSLFPDAYATGPARAVGVAAWDPARRRVL